MLKPVVLHLPREITVAKNPIRPQPVKPRIQSGLAKLREGVADYTRPSVGVGLDHQLETLNRASNRLAGTDRTPNRLYETVTVLLKRIDSLARDVFYDRLRNWVISCVSNSKARQ